MSDQPQTALDQFLATTKRMAAALSEARDARHIPQRVAYDVDRVVIRVEHSHSWNQSIPPAAVEAAKRIKAQVDAEFRADAERERDAKLHALAAEPRVSALGQELAQARINLEVAERDEARLLFDTMASTAEEALAQREAAEAERDALREALALYRDAVRIDVQMDGPKFMGSNVSALKRAWEADRALTKETADV